MAPIPSFVIETLVEYCLGIIVVLLRLLARWKLVDLGGYGADDCFCIVAVAVWTVEVVTIYLVGTKFGNNIGWTAQQRIDMSDDSVQKLQLGSKLVVLGWFAYCTIVWSLKATVLFYYNRLTAGIFYRKIIRGCAVFCGVSYVAGILTVALHCRPFHRNWQVYPDPGRECSAHWTPYIVTAVLNITSDIILLYIPIAIVTELQISISQKIMIGALLCLGAFVGVAALLRCVLSLSNINQISMTAVWASREIFVAIIATNAPVIMPLVRSLARTISARYHVSDARKSPLEPLDTGLCSSNKYENL